MGGVAISDDKVGIMTSVAFQSPPQRAKALRSMSIRYRSDAKESDRYLIDIDARVFAIWDYSMT